MRIAIAGFMHESNTFAAQPTDLQKFREASLTGADFCQATLCSARFGDAKLFAADLREANLQGAREMTADQLSQARTSAGTTLPSGKRGVYLKGSGSERSGMR